MNTASWAKQVIRLSFLWFLVATSWPSHAAEQIVYYHNDALGSPVVGTDASGEVIWREEYSPYGSRLLHESREVDCSEGPCVPVYSVADEKNWFTGKYEESEVGLIYYGARWYSPELGRFLEPDPVYFTEDNIFSFNRYAYANNNPYRYTDPDGESPLDIVFLGIDVARLAVAVSSGDAAAAQAAAVDVAFSAVGVVSPVPGVGQTLKIAKAGDKAKDLSGVVSAGKSATRSADDVAKNAGKPDFVVSPKGTTMPTNKDFNLVDSNKKGGDWLQIHNKHTDAKVDGSPHTHYPEQHGGSRTRETKRTDGGDLDRADSGLRNGTMRERRSRGDKGG